jgi:hypothetical protein
VVAGFFYRLFSRPAPLDFTCDWNHIVDYLAGAASEKQVALYMNIARLRSIGFEDKTNKRRKEVREYANERWDWTGWKWTA